MRQPESEIKTIPFRGGMNTAVEPSALPSGGYSRIYNLRGKHPGFIKRKGQTKQHSTADSTNKVLSLYQFSKAKRVEHHLFAQMSDSDVLEATTNPPGITDAAFGSEVFSGSASPVDASWAVIQDLLLFSNGVDLPQVYPGTLSPVRKFIVYRGAATPPIIPIMGEDYSDEVSDGLSTTVAPLDSLGVLASPDYDCFYVMTPVQAKTLTFTVTKPNGSAAVLQGKYWKNDSTWADKSITDNTITDAKTLAKSGTTTWTPPADEIPHCMFGAPGYWYQYSLASGALDSEVEISEVTYEGNWQNVANIWDGVLLDIIEFQFQVASNSTYRTFGAASIELDSATSSDAFYFSTPDLIEAVYVDVGARPNTTASTGLTFYRWDGAAWQSISNVVDGTAGLSKSGYIWLGRNANFQQAFQTTEYYAYWWKFVVDKTLNDDVIVGLSYRPYFDITELGKGQSVCAWKNRACYSFDRWGQYIYVAANDAPQVLNGDDYGILEAGDGRANKVLAMRKFHNELMVWQAEIGKEGGCLTLFEGYSPTTFGKLLLSSKLGIMNNKSVEVVDGVLTSTATDESVKTLAFCLSRYGVYVSDGRTCSFIDDQVRNHFDPTNTTDCIRRGYEGEMWLAYDSAYNVIRVGLVCGTSATVPNVFLVFDLKDKVWSYDSLGQPLSCMTEASAASGNVPVLQLGGGCADGTVYLLNFGDNDVATAIDSYATMELTGRGQVIQLREMILRMKTQTAGNVTLTPSLNGVAQTAITLAMTAELTNQIIRRHRIPLNLVDQHISLKIQHNTASESLYLEDFGLRLFSYGEQ